MGSIVNVMPSTSFTPVPGERSTAPADLVVISPMPWPQYSHDREAIHLDVGLVHARCRRASRPGAPRGPFHIGAA
jgi:hypothetical protein